MKIRNLELWSAFLTISIITFFYLRIVINSTIPSASGFLGHSLGVIGSVLVLMTEVLYSLRKRYKFARWGKLQNWLSFHIFTGLVGPYLILLHTSWKFNGIAGILMLFTILIVASGFIGRYFYTLIPRDIDGTAIEAEGAFRKLDLINKELAQIDPTSEEISENDIRDYRELSNLHKSLTQKLNNTDRSRKLLSIWHTFHVPLGMILFFTAFIHILATLYFATFLH